MIQAQTSSAQACAPMVDANQRHCSAARDIDFVADAPLTPRVAPRADWRSRSRIGAEAGSADSPEGSATVRGPRAVAIKTLEGSPRTVASDMRDTAVS